MRAWVLEVEVAPPTTDECRRVYDAERARFRTPLLYEASHILAEPQGGTFHRVSWG